MPKLTLFGQKGCPQVPEMRHLHSLVSSAYRVCTACGVTFSVIGERKGQSRGFHTETCLEL